MTHSLLKTALALVLALLFVNQDAWAGCKVSNDKTVRITPPGDLYVSDRAPVGTVVWQSPLSNVPAVKVTCTGQVYGFHKFTTSLEAVPGMTDVYKTRVPYIGIKVIETTSYTAVKNTETRWFTPPVNFDGHWPRPAYQVSLVVIGPVDKDYSFNMSKPVADYASDSPSSLLNAESVHEVDITSTNIRVRKMGSPCVPANVNVNLGTHQATAFTGVGSTTAPASFNIVLTNCPTGTNGITYQIDPVTSVVPDGGSLLSVVTLNAGSTAKGIGVQLLNSTGTPTELATPTSLGNAGGSYTIPLKARFYQTGAVVGAGSANAAMTFTITYN